MKLRSILFAGVAVVGLGGAYYAGAKSQPAPTVAAAPEPSPLVEGLVVPTGLTATEVPLPPIKNPSYVLFGEVDIPLDLMKAPPPPARPDLIVPTLPK